MNKLLWVLLISGATYSILSLEYEGKTFFSYLYQATSPISKATQDKSVELIEESYVQGKQLGQKLFKNSKPKLHPNEKTVTKPQDHISHDEQADLDNLIKDYDSH